jgi:hypothetical protein
VGLDVNDVRLHIGYTWMGCCQLPVIAMP